ncbi:MAG: hypothetical protein DI629_02485 [Mesorhizobium amorphae]|nr:MAG: hypothetical protein DI629_02485 [Mesorhizobium amorphae]
MARLVRPAVRLRPACRRPWGAAVQPHGRAVGHDQHGGVSCRLVLCARHHLADAPHGARAAQDERPGESRLHGFPDRGRQPAPFHGKPGKPDRRRTRERGSLHALALDIDHFKRVNDTHGHAAGDRVLVEVASLIERSIGGGDSVCRMGGEEFSVILPRHDDLSAARLAERLRAGVESLGIDAGSGREITVTISLGLAAWRHGETPADLQRRADEALYAAKRSGRNQMRFAA